MVRHPEEPVGVPETISRQSDGDGVGFAIMYRQKVRRNRSKILLWTDFTERVSSYWITYV